MTYDCPLDSSNKSALREAGYFLGEKDFIKKVDMMNFKTIINWFTRRKLVRETLEALTEKEGLRRDVLLAAHGGPVKTKDDKKVWSFNDRKPGGYY